MKTVNRKQHFALTTVVLVSALLLVSLCISCRQGPLGRDPAVTDTTPFMETTTPDPEQETPEDGDTSAPVPAESVNTADTQAPSPEKTTDEGEVDGEPGTDSSGEASDPSPSPTYEEYCAMTSQEQVDFFNSFANIEDYFLWFEAAKKDYEDRHPGIEIGPDGVIIP